MDYLQEKKENIKVPELHIKIINEIIEKCSNYIDFNEIIYEEIEGLPHRIMGNLALYLNGEFCSENINVYENFDNGKRKMVLYEIYKIFNDNITSIDSIDDEIATLFVTGFYEVLNNDKRKIITEIAEIENELKKSIAFFNKCCPII